MEQNSVSTSMAPITSGDGAVRNKQTSTPKEITKSLIGNWLAWYIILYIIYYVVINYMLVPIVGESYLLQVIIAVILQVLMVFCAWFMSTKFAFKSRRIARDDVKVVMRNLIIFSVVVCVANGIYAFIQVEANFNDVVNSDYGLRIREKKMEQIYSDQEMSEYYQQKSEMVAEVKNRFYINFAIFELATTAVFLGFLPIEKKMISKHISEKDTRMPSPTPPTSSPASPTSSPTPPMGS